MGIFSKINRKLNSIKNPTSYYGNIVFGLKILTLTLFGITLLFQFIMYFIVKKKIKKGESISNKLQSTLTIISNLLFILSILSIIFPCIFILYMKQDYIYKTDKTSLHFSRDKTKNFRTLKNQSYVDNLIWWNTLYILLLFMIIGVDRYISSPLYMQLIKKSLIILK